MFPDCSGCAECLYSKKLSRNKARPAPFRFASFNVRYVDTENPADNCRDFVLDEKLTKEGGEK
jgi:hypothetical protein